MRRPRRTRPYTPPMAQERYTHGYTPVVVNAHARRTAAEAAAFLLPHLDPGARVLDVGCGPGSITNGLAAAVPEGLVVGVDANPSVVVRAAAQAAREGTGNVHFIVSSAYRLPVPDGTFDAVYAHQVLQHLADPVAALVEAHRVLRRGGLLAVRDADYGTMTHHPHDGRLDRWLSIYTAVARANGGEPEAGRRLLGWVQAAGFVDTTATSSTWTYAEPDGRRHWSELWADRILIARFADRTAALGIAAHEELEAIGAAFRHWAAQPDGWFAFLHGEVLARKA